METKGTAMRTLALLIGLAATLPAYAADLVVNWTAPTLMVDGSTVPATGPDSLASTRIEYGSCVGTAFGTLQGQRVVPVPGLATTFTGLAGGTYCVRGYWTTVAGMTSAASNVAVKTLTAGTPTPGVVTIAWLGALQAPVYSVSANNSIGTYMGVIDLGKTCSDTILFTYRGFGFHEITRSDVYLWGSTTLRLAAPCA
jgi:hypothetical protein